jgi:diacylglycerol kinase family enzyme
MRLALITNPLSRRNRRDPTLAQDLVSQMGDLGAAFAPTSFSALDTLAQTLAATDVEVVSISGGDGTSHSVLSALHKAYGSRALPAIHLLRAGTMNTTARNLGLSGKPRARMHRLVAHMQTLPTLQTTLRSTLVVDGHRVGMLFGSGIICGFLSVYYEGGEPTPWKAIRLLAQMGSSAIIRGPLMRRVFQPVEVTVRSNNQTWTERQFSAIAAGTLPDIGLGFRPFAQTEQHREQIQLLGFCGAPWTVVAALPKIRLARPIDRTDVHDVLTQSAHFTSENPISYMVDGDLYVGGNTLRLTTGPTVRFVI